MIHNITVPPSETKGLSYPVRATLLSLRPRTHTRGIIVLIFCCYR